MANDGVQLRIKGKVQGVGFRPYVWQIAHQLSLKGDVSNDAEGVLISLLQTDLIEEFKARLYEECPPLAKIDSVHCEFFSWSEPPIDFTIRHSGEGKMDTQVIPDAATCDACRAELNDKTNRRYRYPFINCTHCGPRFTIIKKMPYDRPNTSMAEFPFCSECRQEYDSPADRRFHAQPNACPTCGPHIWSCDRDGKILEERDNALEQAAIILTNGGIVAVKGIGGFHLACDATDNSAVELLRQRKHRPNKPFAVMIPDASWLDNFAVENIASVKQLLTSAAAPIVLVNKKHSSVVCDAVAPGLAEIGVMLPSNPLQHLLMDRVKKPLVMTSGNASGKPPALSNKQALTELADIADLWLLHNREIIQRADDSLVRYNKQGTEVMRRARGFVPDAFSLPDGFDASPSIIALGADLKNTFCLLRDKSAVLSQHLGDLDDLDIQRQFDSSLALFCDIYKFTPQALVVDAHPGYFSRQIGRRMAQRLDIPLFEVLHHHAHVVSCLAEHGWPRNGRPVIGIAVDGLGYGEDGKLWGGECLLVDYQSCRYLGGLPAVALPGGDLASKQPWRNLFAHLTQFVPDWQRYPEVQALTGKNLSLLKTAIERGINSPTASSTGRLFDAVAAALGICFDSISWEGEAACKLEVLAAQSDKKEHPVTMPLINGKLDLAVFWREWLSYQAPKQDKAHAFHFALAGGFAALARSAAGQYGLNTVAVSGGVMHNRLFRRLLLEQLTAFNVLIPEMLPMGDGGLALGQAVIGVERMFTFGN